MNHSTSNDSEIASEGCLSKPIGTLADLQVKAYEDRVRERLTAKYPTRTPAEASRLEKQIQELVQIYAEGRISCRAIDQVASVEITVRTNRTNPRD
jgi:hypothetical protein